MTNYIGQGTIYILHSSVLLVSLDRSEATTWLRLRGESYGYAYALSQSRGEASAGGERERDCVGAISVYPDQYLPICVQCTVSP